MKLTRLYTLILTIIATAAVSGAEPARDQLILRGRYLVEGIGLCADCHTPRTEKGEYDRARWLQGSPLPFKPTVEMPWVPAAPPIAGLPTMTEAEGIKFLRTGLRPDGTRPLPPMPEFRLNGEDARAITTYLKALKV
jgi:mono/diheme cytochrome c family protein